MAKQLYTNNAETLLSGSITSSASTIILATSSGSIFPAATTGGDYFLCTIYELNGAGVEINHEVVKCTNRVSDTLTVTRGFDGTTARSYPSAIGVNPSQVVYLSLRWTAYAAGNVLTGDDNLAGLANPATARANLGMGTMSAQNSGTVAITGGTITGITDLAIADGGTGASTAGGARTALGAAGSGTNTDITSMTGITGGVGTADFVDFDTTASTTYGIGRMRWDTVDGTIQLGLVGGNVSLQVGQETVARVYNAETTPIVDGEVVYLFGSQSQRISVKRASNAATSTSSTAFAVATETIPAGGMGFVTTEGLVHGLNLSAFNEGDVVWLGATAGTITNSRPNAPAKAVMVGVVSKVSVSDGHLYVRVKNGYGLEELHNVTLSSLANNDSLMYNSATTTWTNRSPTNARTALGLVIGTDVQAYDAGLLSIAGLTTAANKMIYTTAFDTYAVTDLTVFGRTLVGSADAASVRTSLGLGTAAVTAATDYATAAQGTKADSALQAAAIGVSIQGYDANTSKINAAETMSAPKRGLATTSNTGSFNLSLTNNFTCTPTGSTVLTFTNHIAGQSGYVLLVNTGGYAISAAATTKVGSSLLASISTAGTYLISYFDNGTNAYLTASGALA